MCKPRFDITLKSGSLASGDREVINYNGENMKTNEKLIEWDSELEFQTEQLKRMEKKHRDIAIEIADCKNKISAAKGMLILLRSEHEN